MTRPSPLLLAALLAACDEPAPLAFVIVPARVGHDAEAVRDAALVDVEHDGVLELVVARESDVHLLRADRRAWEVATPGSGLDGVEPVDALVRVGDRNDLLARRGGETTLLAGTGLMSWRERTADVPAWPDEAPLVAHADLDGDGAPDEVALDGRTLRVTVGGRDVTAAVGLDAFATPAEGTRLLSGDVDGDGHADVVAVGGRVFVLYGNGGAVAPP